MLTPFCPRTYLSKSESTWNFSEILSAIILVCSRCSFKAFTFSANFDFWIKFRIWNSFSISTRVATSLPETMINFPEFQGHQKVTKGQVKSSYHYHIWQKLPHKHVVSPCVRLVVSYRNRGVLVVVRLLFGKDLKLKMIHLDLNFSSLRHRQHLLSVGPRCPKQNHRHRSRPWSRWQ